jgi:hypothetical protein
MLPLIVGVAFVFVLPHPWNGVGFAAALVWEIVGTFYGLWWSQQAAPMVGTSTLVGLSATVVAACAPWGSGQDRGRDMAGPIRRRCRAW